MHLRRAALLFALVLGLTALAASIAQGPRGPDRPAAPPRPATGSARAAVPGATTVRFAVAARHPRTRTLRRVRTGTHVVVEVDAAAAGQAAIPVLGRVVAVGPASPARFDLLAPPPGRYRVMFTPAGGPPREVGTVVTTP